MRGVIVVVLEPGLKLREDVLGGEELVDVDVVALERLYESLRSAVGLGRV